MNPSRRRALLLSALATPAFKLGAADNDAVIARALREAGTVAVFRHALAPGTFDPPGMRLDDCSTQRNLSEEGRAQARRIGAWFARAQLQPTAVRASPWCRCLETARLAFGHTETWAALGSPAGSNDAARAEQLTALRSALTAARANAGRSGRGFEVWVTHMFVIDALASAATGSGDGLVLRADASGAVEVLSRITIP